MKEIEILVQVEENKNSIIKKIEKYNFQGVKKTFDMYFFDPKRPNLKPDKKMALTECFRIRTKDNKNYMTYKIDKFDKQGIWLYSEEDEIKISDFDSALKIIKNLGLKPLIEIDNTKYTYLTDLYEIVLEDVKGLGLFLEIERLNVNEKEKIEEVKKEIRNFLDSLEIKYIEQNIGKPELMLRKKNK